MKLRPSATVIHIHRIAFDRWSAISAWCAIVSVTPEVSRMAVLKVGIGHGPIVRNGAMVSAGEPVMPACALGQIAWKSGHSSWWSRLPSIGSAIERAQNSAPKNDAKNITSEKMNQLMLQRNDTSTRSEYSPPSLSPMAVVNHCASVASQTTTPVSTHHEPHSCPLIHWLPPRIIRNRPIATHTG